jgi:hypothetical protein
MHWIFRLLLTLATIVVTAVGFQYLTGMSGLLTIPIVIIIGFFPFGNMMKLVLLLIGCWFIYAHGGITMAELERMFHLNR